MNSSLVREAFLSFFKGKGHTVVPSSSLIPAQDPTLLFTNAGMNQFKDLFLGNERRSYVRATSIQKCVRAGGKHNDLDQVGFTPRHLTFFEMMGNFSFGDYFKREAIQYAWDFLTKTVGLPADRLYASVYKDDQESYDLWHSMIGLPTNRIVRCGEKDNFWAMGDTGPCGPCTEIHFDQGAELGCGRPTCGVNCDYCSRVLEVWNLVFMQYNRTADGTLVPLAQTGVDTGMGFERLCAVLQKKESVYLTDIFMPLIEKMEVLSGRSYQQSSSDIQAAFHVLADHVRSTSLLIADGASPSNEGRGYVLRKIIRRAALFAQKLNPQRSHLFPTLAQEFIRIMSPVYPELQINESLIVKVLTQEVERFAESLLQGQAIVDKYLAQHRAAGRNKLTGEEVFKLYDTYGFPPELTRVIAQEHSFTLDMAGFELEMKKQQEQSGKKTGVHDEALDIPADVVTRFVGYQSFETHSKVTYVNYVDKGVWIVTEESPFYVESGGQVNDDGVVIINGHTYQVKDLKKVGGTFEKWAIAVKLDISGSTDIPRINVGDNAHSLVDPLRRMNTVRNHTATHMLQAALIQTLGKQVKQAGSVVHPDYLRFDYTYPEALTLEQIKAIENLVNEKIQEDIKTDIFHTSLDKAREAGVIAFFGEKYNPENVRVVKIPGFSAELCGGTHASSTGIIGLFKIISDTSLATGTRRIVAKTGPGALATFQDSFNTVKALSEEFKAKFEDVLTAVAKQRESFDDALRSIKQLKKQVMQSQVPLFAQQIEPVAGIPFLFLTLTDGSADDLKQVCEELDRHVPGFYFLLLRDKQDHQKVSFFGYVSKAYAQKVNLRDCAQMLKEKYQLRGGGSPTIIQGGGNLGSDHDLKDALPAWIAHSKV